MKQATSALLDDHVIVRVAKIPVTEESSTAFEIYLNSGDLERAARFRFSEDRERFVSLWVLHSVCRH